MKGTGAGIRLIIHQAPQGFSSCFKFIISTPFGITQDYLFPAS